MERSRGTLLLWFSLAVLFTASTNAATPVVVDGRFQEWSQQPMLANDPLGDGSEGGLDFSVLQAVRWGEYLFIHVELGQEISLQGHEGLRLLVDLRGGEEYSETEMGTAESFTPDFIWDFGEQEGWWTAQPDSTVRQGALDMVLAPTITESRFEIALKPTHLETDSLRGLSGSISLAMEHGEEGDRMPDAGGAHFELLELQESPLDPMHWDRQEGALRFVSWNVEHDGLVKRPKAFEKVLQRLQPDIITFTELWDTPPEDVADSLERWLPDDDKTWQAVKPANGVVIASNDVIIGSWPVLGARTGVALLNLPPRFGTPLLIVGCHLPCCNKDEKRQREIDATLAFLRDLRLEEVAADDTTEALITTDTPIMLTGDMNLVGLREQLNSLLTGSIINSEYQPSMNWTDGSEEMLMPLSRHLEAPFCYTWRSDDGRFAPGKLDYFFYTPGYFQPANTYVLDTRLLSESTLQRMNLRREDVPSASDHTPIVLDLLPGKQHEN